MKNEINQTMKSIEQSNFENKGSYMSQILKGHLRALITVSIWSSTFIVSKLLLVYMTPIQILFFRYLVAVTFLSLLYPKFSKPASLRGEILFLAIGAALALYFVFENSALQLTYSSNVSLIVATIPFMTGALSSLFYRKRFFNFKNTAGMVTAYLGVLVIIINTGRLEGIAPGGDLLALGASLMFAFYSILMQKTDERYTLIQLTRKVFLYGLLVLGVLFLATGQSPIPESVDTPALISVFYLGIVASSLAFLLWNRAIQAIGPLKTNQYIYLIPVLTTMLSAVLLKERITLMTLFGTLLILSGLYLSERKETKTEKSKKDQIEAI
jgi:drug/metabolite transporter (DMT)-like permease